MESNAKMLRLFLIVVLTVSTFVDRVCPVPLAGQSNTGEVVANTKNATAASNTDNNDTVAPVNKPVESKNAESSNNASTKENCASTKEQLDMLNCHVTPHDNDDIIESNSSSTTTEATTTIASNTAKANDTESQKPKVTSNKNQTTDKNKEEIDIVPINPTETTHGTTYEVVSTETSQPVNTSVAGNDSKVNMNRNRTDVSISSVAPLVVANASNVEPEVVRGVKSSDRGRKRSMHSGTIALVTAISFAIAIAIAYVGMIVWRRYIEYRYGHRELLVNELEFDTNDLRHFEL